MNILFEVIDTYNDQSAETRIEKTPQTALIGDGTALDSLGLINFILSLETALHEKVGVEISLTDEDITSDHNSPLRTLDALGDYITNKLDKD